MSVCEETNKNEEHQNNEPEADQNSNESVSSGDNSKPNILPKIKFSIDNILSRVSPKRTEISHEQPYHINIPATKSADDSIEDIDVDDDDDDDDISGCDDVTMRSGIPDQLDSESVDGERYSWLQCTRYKPPKLPRSKRKDSSRKRKLGRNPRVPFTQHQVSVLENKFRQTHYLSSVDVAELSAALNLTETRVKIWFQNRRARERRDKSSPADLMKVHNSSPPFPDKQAPHLHNTSFGTLRMPSVDDQGLSTSTGNPLHSMLQSHWGYYQALQGLYGYRPLAAHSLQYYDLARREHVPRIVTLRQSAFTPVTSDDSDGTMGHTPCN